MYSHSVMFCACIFLSTFFVNVTLLGLRVYTKRGMALIGHSYMNISQSNVTDCLQNCLKNCSCLSFQMYEKQCQLCNSSSSSNSSDHEMKPIDRYLHYYFETIQKDNYGHCRTNECRKDINCCLTSSPCQNGGRCYPSWPINSKQRFHCECKPGFYGDRCHSCEPGFSGVGCSDKVTSCHGYWKHGQHHGSGEYVVFDKDLTNTFKVFCDFNKTSNSAWTLIHSFEYSKRNEDTHKKPLYEDKPEAEETPSAFNDYRMSLARMQSIRNDSTNWRATCNYDATTHSYGDYIIASLAHQDIVKLNDRKCVEDVKIRLPQYEGDCKLAAIEHDNKGFRVLFHQGSNKTCTETMGNGECKEYYNDGRNGDGQEKKEYFGRYNRRDPAHDCSSTDTSTTQIWFGFDGN